MASPRDPGDASSEIQDIVIGWQVPIANPYSADVAMSQPPGTGSAIPPSAAADTVIDRTSGVSPK